ncbi:hypothetical protein PLICRDRAFT_171075 [Plicaturopsis crispa FD-325 SS-3]|nr:hypothetical protein PLICRDRAFT_171075 [Plicaturopsis crispa FD-325 SS-3]
MALEKCLEFSIEIPRSRTHIFAPATSLIIPESICMYYEPDFRDERISSAGTGRDISLRYRNSVNGVLSRPHGRGFIYRGGLPARIAWLFGGLSLIESALRGPSIQVTRFNRGFTRLDTETCDEMLAKYEEDILLGRFAVEGREDRRVERSLWPSPKQFDKLVHWRGEWNPKCEEFFQNILQEIRDDNPRPRSVGDWEQYIRTYNRRNPAPVEDLSRDDWTTLSQSFVERFHSSWDGSALRDIVTPERASR